jgi:hypothetical protein
LYPLSARAALADGGDPGLIAFAADFTAYLDRGRAADLQCRLAEATRQFVWAIGARYAESTFRLESALRTAAAVRESTVDDTARLDHELAARQQVLDHLLALDRATADTAQTVAQGSARRADHARLW